MAAKKVRTFLRRFFLTLNLLFSVFYAIACLVPFVNPSNWPTMGLMGLAFPYLALALVFFIIFWGVIKPVWMLIPLCTILLGYKQLSVLFATNKQTSFKEQKDSTHIRIVNWNIRSLEGLSHEAATKRKDRATIPETIMAENPDIICLQEFNTSAAQNNIAPFLQRYRYHYFSHDFKRKKQNYQSGSIIFSRFPISDSGRIAFAGSNGGSLIYADVNIHGKNLRVYTTHLQSFRFDPDDYENLEEIKSSGQKMTASLGIVQKLKLAYKLRGHQADLASKKLALSPYPSIICGDFNDVPNSYTYFKIRGARQDVFLKKSLGIGRTYLGIAPTLRIDYMLPDTNLVIHQFDQVDENLSDHLMLVTDLSLR